MSEHGEVLLKQIILDPDTPNIRGDVIDTTDLQASIKADGLQEPLWVRPAENDDQYYLIDGHRRLAALRALKVKTAEVLVKNVSQAQARRLMLISDMQKPHPHLVLDRDGQIVAGKAMGIKQEIEQAGCSQVELAAALGISADIIGAYLMLFDESLAIKKKVASGQLSITAYARMKHQPPEVKQAIAEIDGNIPASKVRDIIKKQSQPEADDGAEASPVSVQNFYLGIEDDEQPVAAKLNTIRDTLARLERHQITDSELYILDEISQLIEWLT